MKKVLFLTCVIIPLLIKGQDLVVTQKNDTLQGAVKIVSFDRIDRVQINDGKKKIQFTALQVKQVTIEKDVFHPVRIESGYQMMKLVTPGFLSLYLARRPNSLSYEVQYLVKRNGEAMEIPNLTFKKTMGTFLDDCYGIKQKIKDDELGRKDLDQLIIQYNLCIERQTQETQPPSAIGSEDPKMVALTNLKTKLQNSPVSVQKDALDMLDDITDKVKNNKPVPNYLLEGLKEFLKDHPTCQPELEKISALLKIH